MSLTYQEWTRVVEELTDSDENERIHFEAQTSSYGPVLTFSRKLDSRSISRVDDTSVEHDAAEADDEVLLMPRLSSEGDVRLHVLYRISHSMSYQVPVLSLAIYDSSMKLQLPLEELYAMLVPETSLPQLAAGSSLGMLSMVDEQGGDGWLYQVHPCRTQEVMLQILDGQKVSPLRYMMLWFGVIGSSVGLVVPRSLQLKYRYRLEAEVQGQGQG